MMGIQLQCHPGRQERPRVWQWECGVGPRRAPVMMRDSSGLKHTLAWRAAGKPSNTFTGSFSFRASHT